MPQIASRRHPLVQRFRAIATKRQKDDPVLLDGEHLIADALKANIPIEVVLMEGHQHSRIAAQARRAGAEIFDAPADVLEAASPVRTPSGIVALARWAPASMSDAFDARPGLVIGLVDVQDPGNVGSVIRSADALDGSAVFALGDSADPAGWKALRGAMGSTFRLPVSRGSLEDAMTEARRRGIRVIATVADRGVPLDRADLSAHALVLLGNEGAGLPRQVVADADMRLTIPMRDDTNSLNVATSAALVLWDARRRRVFEEPVGGPSVLDKPIGGPGS